MKTKELSIILIITFLFICAAGIQAEENLIQNGTFEESKDNILPLNWRTHSWTKDTSVVQFSIDKEDPHSGNQSVFIHNSRENHGYYIQTISVKEKSSYKISGWIKTENVGQSSEGAGISLINYFDVGGNLKGTNGWQITELYVTTGPGVSSVEVMLQIGNYGALNTGKAWFDDITMEKVKSVPSNAVITEVKNKKDTSNVVPEEETVKDTKQQQKNKGVFSFFLIIVIVVVLAGAAVIVLIIVMRKKSRDTGDEPRETVKEEDTTDTTDPPDDNPDE